MAEKQKADAKKKPAGGAKAKAKGKAPSAPKAKGPAKAAKAPAAKAGRKAEKAEAAPAAARQGIGEDGRVEVVNARNEKVSDLILHPDVFRSKVNEHLMYEAVKEYRAVARAGTHATKNRALVSGSGKKPWRQKGTGRARVGEIRTPLWRHGGTVFGPQPRDYAFAMPKKARLAALRSALSQRAKDGALKVVDHFELAQPKTRELKGILDQLGLDGKTLLVDAKPTTNLVLSGRNIPGLKVVDASQVNVYDVLDCRTVVVSAEAVTKLEERLIP
jgi:large subunit ribosomal protein L4